MKPFSWSPPWYAWLFSIHYLFLFIFFVYPFIIPRFRRAYGGAVVVVLISWCCSLPVVVDAYILVTSPPQTTPTTLIEKHIATNPNGSHLYELKFEHDGPFDIYYVPKEVYDAVELAQCYRVTTHDGYIWHTITFLERILCAEVEPPN